jgi:putative hemolysin
MAYVARFDIDVMFGCASFPGTEPQALALPLSYLHHFHPMPADFMVTAREDLYVPMNRIDAAAIDAREGIRSLPAMLKGYVRAGCCIGDGAVVDQQFDTTDVFIFFPLSGIDARYKSRFGLVK